MGALIGGTCATCEMFLGVAPIVAVDLKRAKLERVLQPLNL